MAADDRGLIYLTGVSGEHTRRLAGEGRRLGLLVQPWGASVTEMPAYRWWAADNGRFAVERFDVDVWWTWLQQVAATPSCLFASAPDVVGDATATLTMSAPWFDPIHDLGLPVAFVSQDGLTSCSTPWDDLDVLFVGGTDAWKFSAPSARLCREAIDRGKRVHVGRVNSERRIMRSITMGAHTVDGTFMRYGADANVHRLVRWLDLAESTAGLPI